MIWLTWRQHRGEAFALAAVLVTLAGLALIHGLPMRAAYQSDGVAACQQAQAATDTCLQIIETFRNRFDGIPMQVAGQLNFLPLLIGVLIGAPLLAREHEQGTWQLAWTQAVPRTRWAITKLTLVLAAVAASAVAVSLVLDWWLFPLASSGFRAERFNFTAPVLAGYFLLAVAIGILAGAVIKRAIPAMAVTLAVFLPLRLLIEFWLRPRYLTPLTAAEQIPGSTSVTEQVTRGDNWILDQFLVDPSGHRLTDADEYDLFGGGVVDQTTIAQHELREAVLYHPASRFWDFQLIETAILAGLAAAALLLAVRQLRRW